jgi:hypothetical protein
VNLQVLGLTAFSPPVWIGVRANYFHFAFHFHIPVEQVIQVAVAKEVGVENPVEETTTTRIKPFAGTP